MEYSGLSELPELNRLILLELSCSEFLRVCQTSREYYEYSQDQVFWKMRLEKDYPGASKFKPEDLTYSEHYRQFYISFKLHNPAEAGYFPVLDWMVEKGDKPDLFWVYYPDETLSLRLMEWLLQHGKTLHDNRLLDAADHGHLKVLKWLEAHEMIPDSDTADRAIETGQLEVLKWLARKGIFPSWGADLAVEHGHLEVLKWMYEEHNMLPSIESVMMVFSLEISKWLEEKGIPPIQENANTAACGGSLEILEWLETRGIMPDSNAIVWAARNKHFEVVKWAIQRNIQIDCIDDMAGSGCLRILKHLYQELRILPTSKGADGATLNGHIEILDWLEQRQILPTFKGADMAAAVGYPEVMRWLVKRGIFPTDSGLGRAVMAGHREVLSLLAEHGVYPTDHGDRTVEVMREVYWNRLVFS